MALPPSEVTLVAELASVTDEAQFVVLYDPDAAGLRVQQAAGTPADARAQELWLIVGEAAPVSLGLLSDDRRTLISGDAEMGALLPTTTLAVSNEPLGGSPTGARKGDVLAAGAITPL